MMPMLLYVHRKQSFLVGFPEVIVPLLLRCVKALIQNIKQGCAFVNFLQFDIVYLTTETTLGKKDRSFCFLDFSDGHFATITWADVHIGSSLRTKERRINECCQNFSCFNQPDEDELVILLLEAETQQSFRDLFSVYIVKEHVPLVQSSVAKDAK